MREACRTSVRVPAAVATAAEVTRERIATPVAIRFVIVVSFRLRCERCELTTIHGKGGATPDGA
jgi:hypothetical protein